MRCSRDSKNSKERRKLNLNRESSLRDLSFEQKRDAVIFGPIGLHTLRADTRIIRREGWYQILTPSSRNPHMNEIVYSTADNEDHARTIVRTTIEEYKTFQVPFKWCVGPWTKPENFDTILSSFGFSHLNVRGLIVDPKESNLKYSTDITVEEVSHFNLQDYLATFLAGWGVSATGWEEHVQALQAELAARTRTVRYFLARYHGMPVGTARFIYREEGFIRTAYLTGGNVLKEFRGRGIYRALLQHRFQMLTAQGIKLATTQASEQTTAPILEKLGFESVYKAKVFLVTV